MRKDFAASVLRDLLKQVAIAKCDVVHFGILPEHMRSIQELERQLRSVETYATRVQCARDERPHMLLDLPKTFDAYCGGLSTREKRNIGKENRRLVRNHEVRCDDASQQDGEGAAIAQFFEFHQSQWTAQGHRGHFGDWPNAQQFHRDLAFVLGRSGRLRLRRITVDGHLFAMTYGIRFGQRIHWYLAARSTDPRWHFCFPGRVGACDLIKAAIGEGVEQIDLGLGFYDYKLKLGGRLSQALTFTAVRKATGVTFRVGLLRGLGLLHELLGYRLWYKRVLPRIPFLKLGLKPSWIRTRLWPADAAALLRQFQAALFWLPSMVARHRNHVPAILYSRHPSITLQHIFARGLSSHDGQPLEPNSGTSASLPAGVTLRRLHWLFELSDAERNQISQYGGRLLLLRFDERFERSEALWLFSLGDEVVGFCWIAEPAPTEDSARSVAAGDVTVGLGATLPKWRDPAILCAMFDQIRKYLSADAAHNSPLPSTRCADAATPDS
ncbi:MAG: GNAT family N-acetyltransferase [Planctomycetota bacterium]|nr:GNAT family N-acetyltransferase [Planctomycetota bacterium]